MPAAMIQDTNDGKEWSALDERDLADSLAKGRLHRAGGEISLPRWYGWPGRAQGRRARAGRASQPAQLTIRSPATVETEVTFVSSSRDGVSGFWVTLLELHIQSVDLSRLLGRDITLLRGIKLILTRLMIVPVPDRPRTRMAMWGIFGVSP
jgi:hypothetical protein